MLVESRDRLCGRPEFKSSKARSAIHGECSNTPPEFGGQRLARFHLIQTQARLAAAWVGAPIGLRYRCGAAPGRPRPFDMSIKSVSGLIFRPGRPIKRQASRPTSFLPGPALPSALKRIEGIAQVGCRTVSPELKPCGRGKTAFVAVKRIGMIS